MYLVAHIVEYVCVCFKNIQNVSKQIALLPFGVASSMQWPLFAASFLFFSPCYSHVEFMLSLFHPSLSICKFTIHSAQIDLIVTQYHITTYLSVFAQFCIEAYVSADQ